MKHLNRLWAGLMTAFLAAVLLLQPCDLPKAWAAQKQLTSYTTEKSSDGSWYVNVFDKSSYFFLTSVAKAAITSYPVTITVPSGCTLTANEELMKKAEKAVVSNGTSYTFSEAGTNSVTITTAEENGVSLYGKFYFTILPSSNTEGNSNVILEEKTKPGYQVFKHESGATYSSTVKDGDILYEPAVFIIGAGMKAEVTHNNQVSAYKSGEKLVDTGSYTMKFTSNNRNGRSEESQISFSIKEIRIPEPEYYGPVYPIDPSKSINPNLADVGKPDVGNWTWETAIKSNQEDIVYEEGSGDKGRVEIAEAKTNEAEISYLDVKKVGSTADDDDDDEDSDSRWKTEKNDEITGPGVTKAAEENETEPGKPKVVQVELGETYHEEYKMYELSFANKYFFYSNVADGAITSKSKPVIFDVPSNISVVVEKDGLPYEYYNKASISAPGTYVITLSVTDDLTLEPAKQTIYQAIYHFRIEEKEPETEAASQASTGFGSVTGGYSPSVLGGNTFRVEDAAEGTAEETSPSTEASQETEESSTENGSLPEGQSVLDENSNMQDIDRMVEELTTPEPVVENTEFTSEKYTGLEESYDKKERRFEEKLRSGTVFYANIANGMATNKAVHLTFPESMTIVATKDDVPFEYVDGTPIEQSGVYRFEFQETKVDYTINYDRPPFFTFRIVNDPVNDMEIFNVPDQFTIKSVMMGQEEIKVENPGYIHLREDGDYHIITVMDEEDAQFTVNITRDTEPVSFGLVGVANGISTGTEVKLEYYSEDVDHIRVYRNGVLSEGFSGSVISESGNYQVFVYDAAGNVSSARFQMKYKMNIAGIVAILLIIALTVAIVLFVKKVKRDVKVR